MIIMILDAIVSSHIVQVKVNSSLEQGNCILGLQYVYRICPALNKKWPEIWGLIRYERNTEETIDNIKTHRAPEK